MANVQHAIVRDDVKARQKLIHVVDGGIAFNTLERAFPNAYGLHYVEDGNEIALDVDANNNKFFLPSVDLNCTIFHIDFKSVDSNSGYDPDRIIETLSSDVSKDLTIADNLAIFLTIFLKNCSIMEGTFITVTDESRGVSEEVPVVDGSINFMTLQRAFPGFGGLKFKNAGDPKRYLLVATDDNKFLEPMGGWGGKEIFIFYPPSPPTAATLSDPDSIIQALSSDVAQNLTIADNLALTVSKRCAKYLFYTKLVGFQENEAIYDPGENNKFIFTVFSKTCAATSKHCLRAVQTDLKLRDADIGDSFRIFACENPRESFLVKVKYFSSRLDFAVVEVVSGCFNDVPSIDTPERGRRGVCLGLPYFEAVDGGDIVETQAKERDPVPFSVEIAALDVPVPGMFAGSCGLTHGYSGAGLFRIYGNTDLLMGICCRGRIPPDDWAVTWSRTNWLHRRSLAYYISSIVINAIIGEQEEPVKKKSKPSDVEKPTELSGVSKCFQGYLLLFLLNDWLDHQKKTNIFFCQNVTDAADPQAPFEAGPSAGEIILLNFLIIF
uniref:TAR DNA-binding protein 43 N-terminal domain-containing protein n=1 Tax=Panagrolaimus sp. JU765 TaxID=591449 RepID=A0AC34QP30_9BILA